MGNMLSAQRELSDQLVNEKAEWEARKQRAHDFAQTGVVVSEVISWDARSGHPNAVSGYICKDGKCNFAEVLEDMKKNAFLARSKQLERCNRIVADIAANSDLYNATTLGGFCIHNMGREIVSFRNYGTGAEKKMGYIEYSDLRRDLALKAHADFMAAMKTA